MFLTLEFCKWQNKFINVMSCQDHLPIEKKTKHELNQSPYSIQNNKLLQMGGIPIFFWTLEWGLWCYPSSQYHKEIVSNYFEIFITSVNLIKSYVPVPWPVLLSGKSIGPQIEWLTLFQVKGIYFCCASIPNPGRSTIRRKSNRCVSHVNVSFSLYFSSLPLSLKKKKKWNKNVMYPCSRKIYKCTFMGKI